MSVQSREGYRLLPSMTQEEKAKIKAEQQLMMLTIMKQVRDCVLQVCLNIDKY